MLAKLPGFLADRRKRYKEDTCRLAKWLATTGKQLGYNLEVKEVVETPARGPQANTQRRLKGKARKAAHQNGGLATAVGEDASSVKEATTIHRSLLTVQQFHELAKHVAEVGAAVPVYVVKIAERAVKVRKQCSEWFRRLLSKSREKKVHDAKHWHFIGVLESVVGMLRPLCSAATDKPAADVNDHEELAATANRFAALDIEGEEDLEDDDNEATTTSLDVGKTNVRKVYDVEEDDSEVLFTIYCLFMDLDNIRSFLQDTWTDYKAGKIDLITASVTTNTAVEMVRDIQNELASTHASISNYDTAQKLLLQSNHPAALSGVQRPVRLVLTKDWSQLDDTEQMWQDRRLLMQVMPEFVMAARVKEDLPVEDVLSREFAVMAATKEISLVLVFATQVFLDIHHILGKDVARGLVQMKVAGVSVKRSLQGRLEKMPKTPIETWPAQDEMYVKGLQHVVDDWILEDRLYKYGMSVRKSAKFDKKPEAYLLLKWHPWLCGMIQFKMHLQAQEIGITYAGAWGSILCVAHLYEACKHTRGLQQEWPDMEWIMNVHQKERVFRGRVPTTMGESLTSLCLIMGVSATEFASGRKNRKTDGLKHSAHGPVGLKENSPVSLIFRPRLCHGESKVVLTTQVVDQLLQEALASNKLADKLSMQWSRKQSLSPLQLLAVLQAGLLAEKETIRFDYMRMHNRCMDVLRDLHTAVDSDFTKYHGPGYMENETQLAWLVGGLFLTVNGTYQMRDKLKLDEKVVGSKLMKTAAEVLMPWIEKEGDAEMSLMRRLP
ncbi:hypothetical protein HDU86_005011 [Geranomyces michiganensis]|nr:hypothetical protein HDU86_005011 [Geranomyces michiganensis]